jgi:hypothetical protein
LATRAISSLAVLLCCGLILAQEPGKRSSTQPGVEALSNRRFPDKKKALDFNFDSAQYPVRSNAPASVVIRISPTKENNSELITGTLLLDAYSGPDRLFSAEYLDVAASEQPQRFGLPSMAGDGPIRSIELHVRYRTKEHLFDFDRHMVRVPTPTLRKFCIGVPVLSKVSSVSRLQRYFDTLRLEDFEPLRNDSRKEDGIQTQNVLMLASELPQEPTSLCGYDILLLQGAGFNALREEQLQAISTWTAGGGSVIVAAEGRIGLPQVSFLNTILRAEAPSDQFHIDANRNLVPPRDERGPRIVSRPFGIGRSVVMWGADSLNDSDLAVLLAGSDWRNAVVDAWRIRESHRKTFVETGKWNSLEVIRFEDMNPGMAAGGWGWQTRRGANMYRGLISPFEEIPLASAPQLIETLMPRTVRLIPMEVVVVILAAYVLLVGPADYLLLGMLRARKFTWVLFPAITVAITILTVVVSERYLTFDEQRRRMIISDIGDDNKTVRVNTYELLFLPSAREVSSDATREIVTDLPMSIFGDVSSRLSRTNRTGELTPGADPPRVVGRYPSNFSVKQNIPQTTPRMHRRLSFVPNTEMTPNLDWNALKPEFDETQVSAVLQNNGNTAEFETWRRLVFNSASEAIQKVTEPELVPQVDFFVGPVQSRYGRAVFEDIYQTYGASRQQMYFPHGAAGRANLIAETTRTPDIGFFSLCSQLSPAGGSSFDDLILLDTTNVNSWMVCVTFRWKDEVYVFRKRYELPTRLGPILRTQQVQQVQQMQQVDAATTIPDPNETTTTPIGPPGDVTPSDGTPVNEPVVAPVSEPVMTPPPGAESTAPQ